MVLDIYPEILNFISPIVLKKIALNVFTINRSSICVIIIIYTLSIANMYRV
jgi:hypothetical protein